MAFGPLRLPGLVCAACVIGCGADAPAPSVASVTPARAYTDRRVRLSIRGDGFLPTFRIDQASGERRADISQFTGRVGQAPHEARLDDFDWLDMNHLSAWMAAGLPAGEHTVEITDPRGKPGKADKAFWSLGPDNDPPVVTFEKPHPLTPVAAGMQLDIAIAALDPDPGALAGLRWEAFAGGARVKIEHCRLGPDPAGGRCDSQVLVPRELAPGDSFVLSAHANDGSAARNRSEQVLSFTIQAPPTATQIRPARGGIVGGTDLVIKGSGFFAGTQVYIGDLLMLPKGGVVLDARTIIGRAPAHAEGSVSVLIRTPIGDAQLPNAFQYEPPPRIETVAPEVGDADGGTAIRVRGQRFTKKTQIFFGDTLVAAVPCEEQQYVSDVEISGFAPAGKGTTSVWAFDGDLGWTRMVDGFSWRAP